MEMERPQPKEFARELNRVLPPFRVDKSPALRVLTTPIIATAAFHMHPIATYQKGPPDLRRLTLQ